MIPSDLIYIIVSRNTTISHFFINFNNNFYILYTFFVIINVPEFEAERGISAVGW